jgi:hypothetical protein
MNLVKPDSVTTTGSIARSTTGTYIDSAGVMQTAAIDAVRVNYDPATKEFLGILIENASTNLLTYSQNFTGTDWSVNFATVSTGSFTAPDASSTAKALTWNTSTIPIGPYLNKNLTGLTIGEVYTQSIYVKYLGQRYINLATGASSSTGIGFDLISGIVTQNTIGVTQAVSSQVQNAGNGWWRVSYQYTASDTTGVFLVAANSGTSSLIIGNGTTGVYIWGAQLETLDVPSSYILTTSASVTRAADIITGSGLVYTNLTESNPEWSSATTYALGAKVVYGVYGTYQSLQSGNLNHTPPITSPFTDAYWVRTGPTNKMAMFDDQISSVSSGTTDIIFAVVASAIDSVALLNITASKTNIAVTDKDSKALVYHNSQQLSGGESLDWYSYFFYDSDTQKTSSIYLDIPTASNSLITIKVSGTGTVSVGSYINGQIKYLGDTQYGVSAGIIDYSRKDTDEFGNTTFTKRNFSKRMNASVSLTNSNLNRVQRILYGLRATPVLWIASTDAQFEEPLIVYGFYRDFSTEISYPTHSICNLQVEGLI